MVGNTRERFCAGELTDHVALFFAEDYLDADTLETAGERVDAGIVLVVPGERGRSVFQRATGLDPMGFSRSAGGTEGSIAHDLTGATCPDADADGHAIRFIFAFAQEETPDAGGRYAEGDVIHGYAACTCGTTFSERWVV